MPHQAVLASSSCAVMCLCTKVMIATQGSSKFNTFAMFRKQSLEKGFTCSFLASKAAFTTDFANDQAAEGAYVTSADNYPRIDFYIVRSKQFQLVGSVP